MGIMGWERQSGMVGGRQKWDGGGRESGMVGEFQFVHFSMQLLQNPYSGRKKDVFVFAVVPSHSVFFRDRPGGKDRSVRFVLVTYAQSVHDFDVSPFKADSICLLLCTN